MARNERLKWARKNRGRLSVMRNELGLFIEKRVIEKRVDALRTSLKAASEEIGERSDFLHAFTKREHTIKPRADSIEKIAPATRVPTKRPCFQ